MKVLSDTPVGGGYLEAGASVSRLAGPEAWLEAGAHPMEGLGLFGRAYAKTGDYGAMVGARLVW